MDGEIKVFGTNTGNGKKGSRSVSFQLRVEILNLLKSKETETFHISAAIRSGQLQQTSRNTGQSGQDVIPILNFKINVTLYTLYILHR